MVKKDIELLTDNELITLYKELSNIRDTASFFSEISDRKDEIIEFTKKVQKKDDEEKEGK